MERPKYSRGPKYTQSFERQWRGFTEALAAKVRRHPILPAAAKVVTWEMIDRANKLDGSVQASSRGIAVNTGMNKNTVNTALHLLHEQRVIDLENSETEGGANNQAVAYLLLDEKRWPGPGPDDIRVSQELGQGVPKSGTGGVPPRRDTRTLLREPLKNLPGADAHATLAVEGSRARPQHVAITIGSKQWDAWLAYYEIHDPQRVRFMRHHAENGRSKGWSEPTEWPPAAEAS
jgi:hypothetical protein